MAGRQFLSPEWLMDLAVEAAGIPPSAAAPLTLRHVVTGGPQGDVAYRVTMGAGGLRVETGPGDADVEVRQSYETAAAISRGELSPASAFAAGLVRVGGRPGLLSEHREALTRLGDVFAGLRARTAY